MFIGLDVDVWAIIATVIANIATVIVAVVALTKSVHLHRESLKLSEKITAIQVMPLLKVVTITETDRIYVGLHNYGIGPAVITGATFRRDGGGEQNDLVKALSGSVVDTHGIPLDRWPTRQVFGPGEHVLEVGQSFRLAELSLPFLNGIGKNPQEAMFLLKQMCETLNQVEVDIPYTDVTKYFTECVPQGGRINMPCHQYEQR